MDEKEIEAALDDIDKQLVSAGFREPKAYVTINRSYVTVTLASGMFYFHRRSANAATCFRMVAQNMPEIIHAGQEQAQRRIAKIQSDFANLPDGTPQTAPSDTNSPPEAT